MSMSEGSAKKESRRSPAPRPKIRVVLIDGGSSVRGALRALSGKEHDIDLVGDAHAGPAAVALVAKSRPDVAVIDLGATGLAGLEIGEAVKAACETTRVLVVAQDTDASAVRTAIGVGATGYVVKDADAAELATAIRAVHRGRLFISLGAAEAGLASSLWGRTAERGRPTGLAALSARERHVLTLVAHGYTSREIAQSLSVSAKTVETYRARISVKLGRQSRAELVQFALECGLLKPGGSGVGPSGGR
jgi:two-component system, NarL family, response regulator NreC